MPLPSIICKVHLEINKDEGRDDDIYELSEKDSSIVTEFLKRVEMPQRSSVPPRPRNARSEPVGHYYDITGETQSKSMIFDLLSSRRHTSKWLR